MLNYFNFINNYAAIFLSVLLISLGIILTLSSNYFQIKKFKVILTSTFGNLKNDGFSGFKAMSVALGGTIGIGNIAGVTTAICIGGPGAVLWLILSGVLGMIIKFYEVYLAVQTAKDVLNERMGGPMVYMEMIFGNKIISSMFCFFCISASFFIGNLIQTGSVCISVESSFGIEKLFIGIILVLPVALIVVGKSEIIQSFSFIFVPLMSIFYVFSSLYIIFLNSHRLPLVIGEIITGGFGFKSISGGFVGSSLILAIKQGIGKGIFTHEAGMGSSPIAHASAKNTTPIKQAMWGVGEVFCDTFICVITALCVLTAGGDTNNLQGIALVNTIFNNSFGHIGSKMLSISCIMFSFGSIVSWGYYGKCAISYLTKNSIFKKIYIVIYILIIPLGAVLNTNSIWSIAEVLNTLMATTNIITIFLVYPKITEKIKIFNVEIRDEKIYTDKQY